jgi:hypothetical protein
MSAISKIPIDRAARRRYVNILIAQSDIMAINVYLLVQEEMLTFDMWRK